MKNWKLFQWPSVGVWNTMQPLKGQGKLCELIPCSLHDVSLSEKDKFRMWIVWPMFHFKRHASCVCALWVTASMCVYFYFLTF